MTDNGHNYMNGVYFSLIVCQYQYSNWNTIDTTGTWQDLIKFKYQNSNTLYWARVPPRSIQYSKRFRVMLQELGAVVWKPLIAHHLDINKQLYYCMHTPCLDHQDPAGHAH